MPDGRADLDDDAVRAYVSHAKHQRRRAQRVRERRIAASEYGDLRPGVVCLALRDKDGAGFNRTLYFYPDGPDDQRDGELIAKGWTVDWEATPEVVAVDPQGGRYAVGLFGSAPWAEALLAEGARSRAETEPQGEIDDESERRATP